MFLILQNNLLNFLEEYLHNKNLITSITITVIVTGTAIATNISV